MASRALTSLETYLHERRSGIGSSDVAPILGLSRYRSAVDVWREKVGQESEDKDSPAMHRGRFLEPAIIAWYGAEVGEGVDTGRTLVDDWRRAQLDGLTASVVVEAKSMSRRVWESGSWGEPGTDEIPDDYLCQVQWQLDMAERDAAHVPVAVLPEEPDRVLGRSPEEVIRECDLHIFVVRRADHVVARIVEECAAFWREHVLRRVPPEPRTFDEAQAIWWRETAGTTVKASESATRALAALQFARGLGKIQKSIEERAKFILASEMRDGEMLAGPTGLPWLRQKVQTRRGYTVEPTESKPLRILKDWKATPEAAQVAGALDGIEKNVTAYLPIPETID